MLRAGLLLLLLLLLGQAHAAIESYNVLGGPNSGFPLDAGIDADAKGWSCITGSYGILATAPFQIPPFSLPTENTDASRTYVALIDPKGTPVWATYFSSTGTRGIRGAAAALNGKECIVVGTFDGVADFQGATVQGAVQDQDSMYVAKLSRKNGQVLGVEVLTTSFGYVYSPDRGNHLAIDNKGAVWLTGYVVGPLNDQSPGQQYTINGFPQTYGGGDADILLARLDSKGTWKWVKTFGGTGTDNGVGLGWSKNKLGLAFNFFSPSLAFGGKTQPLESHQGAQSMGLALFNPKTGMALAAWNFGDEPTGDGEGFLFAIDTDRSGAIYITGRYQNTITWGKNKRGTHVVTTSSTLDKPEPFLVKFVVTGVKHYVAWATVFHADDGDGVDVGSDVAVLKSGKYVYMSGEQGSATLTVGGTTLTNELVPDYARPFFVQLNAKTGVPVAVNNQLAPVSSFTGDQNQIAVDGKGRLHLHGLFFDEGTPASGRTICGGVVLPEPFDPLGGVDVYTAIVSSISCTPAKKCTGFNGCTAQQ